MTIKEYPYALVLHGGVFYRSFGKQESQEKRDVKLTELKRALLAGFAILENRGSSLDAVQTSVRVLESVDFFNAGRGSVLTSAENYELDAGIMDGNSGRAGGAAVLKHVKHPIDLARTILESKYVLLAGTGAENFAQMSGLDLVANDYFENKRARHSLEDVLRGASSLTVKDPLVEEDDEPQKGTVGAVALDLYGHLAAASSTGGLTNKPPGRIGDTSVTGAGFFADKNAAIACTGVGELFMVPPAASIAAMLLQQEGAQLQQVLGAVLAGHYGHQKLEGGMIAVTKGGEIAMSYNTPWMYRAWIKWDGTWGMDVGSER